MLAEVQAQYLDPWHYQWHPEVWVLVVFLVGAYIYMVRVVGPHAVEPGQPVVTRKNIVAFVAGIVMLEVASDWPLHDIAEDYLYSAHMLQHMMLSFFMPPLMLLATPTWLLRVLMGDGKLYRAVKFMCRPVVAGVSFNLVVMLVHSPAAVNESVANGPFHYSEHFLLVMVSLLMWMPICGPIPEFRVPPLVKCIYLFLMSIVPTVPAAWLALADGVVYKVYDRPVRMWGVSAIADQQMAGLIMKIGGTLFLWTLIVFIFLKRFAAGHEDNYNYRRDHRLDDPEAAPLADDEVETPLTTADVERAFAASSPVPAPEHTTDG